MRKLSHSANRLLDAPKYSLEIERFFLILIITVLVIIWFKKGLILGSGESGLPFYNTQKLLELSENAWTDVPLGTNSVIGSANYPYYMAIAFLQSLGIPSFLIQATLYWILFMCGVLSIHKIASLFNGNTALSRFSSALFYIFNPITLVSVLHRFQYTLIFFYCFMPLAFLIYLKSLEEKRFANLILLGLLCIVVSPMFIGIGLMQMFFGVLALLSLFYFIDNLRQKRSWPPLYYFLAFVVIFILMNIWWLMPLFLNTASNELRQTIALKYFNSIGNVDTFNAISRQVVSVYGVFQLFKPNTFPIEESPWHWIYASPLFVTLSFLSTGMFILGLIKAKKNLLFKFLATLSLVTMFWMKGSLPPLGTVTLLIFQSLTFLHPFRNPFEKIGMLLPFAMAVPVGFGIAAAVDWLSVRFKIRRKIVIAVLWFVVFPVYMFPIATGLAFTGGPPPANNIEIGQYVKVPEYYKEAKEWLNRKGDLFRILVLPIAGEGMTYKWEYGFSGVELSNNLFNQSMISFESGQGFLPEMVSSIKETLYKYPYNMRTIAQLMNVKYIMVRDDINYVERNTENPLEDAETVSGEMKQDFAKAGEFGKLQFFELDPDKFYPRIFASNSLIYTIDPLERYYQMFPFSDTEEKDLFVTSTATPENDPYMRLGSRVMVNGILVRSATVEDKDPFEELPIVSIYNDSLFYPFVRFKENLESRFLRPDIELIFRTNILAKRLVEFNHAVADKGSRDKYIWEFRNLSSRLKSKLAVDHTIVRSLMYQKKLIEDMVDKVPDKDSMSTLIKDMDQLLIDLRVKPIFGTQKSRIYRFGVPRGGEYEILLLKEGWRGSSTNLKEFEFDLDGNGIKVDLSGQEKEKDFFSFGKYQIGLGDHEIAFLASNDLNLIPKAFRDELALQTSNKQVAKMTIPIVGMKPQYEYLFSFDYLLEKGNDAEFAILSDIDSYDMERVRIPQVRVTLNRDNYDFTWKHFQVKFKPSVAAKQFDILFKLKPFGDCKGVVMRFNLRFCKNKYFAERLLKDSVTKIRNLTVDKTFDNSVILRESKVDMGKNVLPKVDFMQISPSRYRVNISNAAQPFLLVLSTAFDPHWQAYYVLKRPKNIIESLSGSIPGDVILPRNHLLVNGYANSWYIDRSGNYELFLEYTPERVFIIGRKISLVFIVLFVLILAYRYFRKGGGNGVKEKT